MSSHRIGPITPEFYFHFKLERRPTPTELAGLRESLSKIAKTAFAEKFPSIELSFIVDLETGTIRGWIRATGLTVAAALIVLATFCEKYGSVKSGAREFYGDVNWALTEIRDQVYHRFAKHGIAQRIRTERRQGAIARLDHLIDRYQKNEIDYNRYMEEATTILRKVAESDEKCEYVPALRLYLDAKYSQPFDWPSLQTRIQSLRCDSDAPRVPRGPARRKRPPPSEIALLAEKILRRKKNPEGRTGRRKTR